MKKPQFVSLSDLSPMTPLSSYIDKIQASKKDPVIVDFLDQNPFLFSQKLFVTENPSTLNQLPSINNFGSQIFDDIGKEYQNCYNLNTSNNIIINETPVVIKSPWCQQHLLGQSEMNVLSQFSMEGLYTKSQEKDDASRFGVGNSLKMMVPYEGGIGDNSGVLFYEMNTWKQQQLYIANEINRSIINSENCKELFGQVNQVFQGGNNQKGKEDIAGGSIASKNQEVLQHSISEEFTNDSFSNAQGNHIHQLDGTQVRISLVPNNDSQMSNHGYQPSNIEMSQGVNGIQQFSHEQLDQKPLTHLNSVFLPLRSVQSQRMQSGEGMPLVSQPELYEQQARDFKLRIEAIKQSMKERTQSSSSENEKEEKEGAQKDQDESSTERKDNTSSEEQEDEAQQENSIKDQQFLNLLKQDHPGCIETCLPSKQPPPAPSKNLHDYSRRVDFCNCRKTKCLKLYCDCFINGNFCNAQCLCLDCGNVSTNIPQRNQAIQEALSRNPEAFNQKFEVSNKEVAHRRGCNCSKTHCLKKYCECFNAGLKCKDNCRCEECENGKHDEGNHNHRQMRLEEDVGVMITAGGGAMKQSQQSHRESSSTIQVQSHEAKISNQNLKRHHRDIETFSDVSRKQTMLDDYKEPVVRKRSNNNHPQQQQSHHEEEQKVQRQQQHQQQEKAYPQQKQQSVSHFPPPSEFLYNH